MTTAEQARAIMAQLDEAWDSWETDAERRAARQAMCALQRLLWTTCTQADYTSQPQEV